MYLTDVSIRRPALSWVLSLILVVFGTFVFSKLPVRELPSGLQPPVVQVQVKYASASAPIVDEEVTQVIEEVIGGAEGIKNIDAKSENGKSTINIEFDTDIDLDNAANDVRERVARVVGRLPTESEAPRILKQSAGFTTTMWLALSSETWSDLELGDYAERYLVDQFSSIKNVGRIRTGGLREQSIRVWIDPIKLAANNLTIQEVERSLRNENVRLPAGTLEAENIDLTINIDKSYNDLEKLKGLPIKKAKDNIVRLSDIANLELGPVTEKVLFRAQSKGALNLKTMGIGIYARSGASTVELSKDVEKKIKEIRKTLPADLNLEIAFNRATYIGEAINEVYKTLVIAFILVVIIIYLFLGNLKAVIVPAIALPVSLIATFLGLYIFDLSINIFVLLSFILAIGIITDDSVIMTDAIYRRIENGETPLVAAYKGSKQITFAIIATTLILVAVFLPLIFIEGIAGTLFKETAIALSFAIVVSSFVALTLSPMLGSKFLDKKKKSNFLTRGFDKFFQGFLKFYTETLGFWMNKKKTIITFIIFIVVASGALYNYTKKELLPLEDRGVYLVIGFTDEGSSFQYTQKRAEDVEKRLIPLLDGDNSPYNRFLMIVPGFGSENSFLIISLLDNWKNRKQNSQTIMRQAIGKIVTVPQTLAFPISPQSIRVSSYNKPVQMVIYGNTYEELEQIQTQVIRMLRQNRNLSRLESDYTRNKPEVNIKINKNKAKDLGISAEDMLIRLDGFLDERDLEPFRYPSLKDLRALGYRSVCLGSYIPWDVKMQVEKIRSELGWQGDVVENVPEEFNYEKIECWMQGVRDFIKYIKRGYTRPTHLAAIDLRNQRITKEEAQSMIRQFEGRRPPSLDLFLDYVGLSEEEFYAIAVGHQVSPWQFDQSEIRQGETTPDFQTWLRGDGLDPAEADDQISRWSKTCESCGSSSGCGA